MPKPPDLSQLKKELNHAKLIKKTAPKEKPTLTLDDVSEQAETIERFKRERLKRNDTSCVEFWACLVFQSYEQRNEFLDQLRANGINALYGKYIDGEEFADKHGYRIDKNELPPEKSNMNKKRTALVNLEKIRSSLK